MTIISRKAASYCSLTVSSCAFTKETGPKSAQKVQAKQHGEPAKVGPDDQKWSSDEYS